MQKFLKSCQQYCVIIYCDIIPLVHQKSIPWVISTAYKGKHVINQIVYSTEHVNRSFQRPTVFWLVGGGVDPVVFIGQQNQLELLDLEIDGPGVGHKVVKVRDRLHRPIIDQVCHHVEKNIQNAIKFNYFSL